jgi:hypothetical protein
MGRVQNSFYFFGTLLQVVLGFLVGAVAHQASLTAGFAIIGLVYLCAFLAAARPIEAPSAVASGAAE